MKMLKLLTQVKEAVMEKLEKKHIKKLKPQAARPSGFGSLGENGGNGCPPIG